MESLHSSLSLHHCAVPTESQTCREVCLTPAGAGPTLKPFATGAVPAQLPLQFHHFATAKLPVSAGPLPRSGLPDTTLGLYEQQQTRQEMLDAPVQALGDSGFVDTLAVTQSSNSASRWALSPSLRVCWTSLQEATGADAALLRGGHSLPEAFCTAACLV